MTNTEIIQAIRKEIISRINKRHLSEQAKNELVSILSFLDTLESETTYDTQQYTPRPSVDIEDVARVQFASHAKVFDKKRKAVFNWEQFKEVAGIFYGFGKKNRSGTIESEKPVPNDLEEAKEAYCEEHNDECFDAIGSKCPHIRNAFIAGAKWQAEQLLKSSPLPEDTVLFNKGVAEGRRLAEEEQADLFTIVALDAAQRAREQILKDGNVILTEEDFDAEKEKSMERGYNLCKEQMLKEAVEGKVFMSFAPGHNQMVMADVDLPTNTKVKIIIVKED